MKPQGVKFTQETPDLFFVLKLGISSFRSILIPCWLQNKKFFDRRFEYTFGGIKLYFLVGQTSSLDIYEVFFDY